ncbi:universal stress protein [Leeuwenhoekiella sp. MAR_2009_132]|uniref:universal stress protein n=1 Tax=Leeuwenhoekiella sp. MAR_2009_132 TaxID=1392489 RepID=UPI00048DF762|nr:universal stress protein [Leeuwenhoekiella sp. MAR_2009_132]
MKKILIPIDFSEHSEYALRTAAILAKKYKASLVVLHMIGLSKAILSKNESEEQLEGMFYVKLAAKKFKEFLTRDYLKGLEVETTVQNFDNLYKINDVAQEFNADLIVMGSHGVSGLDEVFVGSNTEKVVRTVDIPVLVIKKNINEFNLKKVVFACDFDIDFVEPFKRAVNFFKNLEIEFQVVFINTPKKFLSSQEMEGRALKFMLHSDLENTRVFDKVVYYNDYSLEEGIYTYCNQVEADMIAIPTHGRKGLAHFFSENYSDAFVNHSNFPIMTFKV